MERNTRPVTHADLAALQTALEGRIEQLDKSLVEWKEEIKRHFDVVAERNLHDLGGAHHDDLEVLKDAKKNHEERIRRLERATGMIAA